ncbi:protease modulator HflC [Pelagicoccus sp. SDUM812003]|uniref:protease modulator HflC n=1 Tax=Pelagicoccus sp. SDUM812003 TaxID=3041267 RepID=UPI00280E6F13|nr:protease modulator HflC [Pelagicoccus sp. SDUM812003]MDQ8203776.1 protease modulator HflC [Pelagicoccus sp. SDUM812003]
MKSIAQIVALLVIVVGAFVVYNSVFTVSETEQVLITQFGKPVGEAITESGLHFKIPFIQEVNVMDKRILNWDGRPHEMSTKEKTYILVDTYGRWRISDAKQYFLRLSNERSAQSRIDNILGSETRSAVANHELIEMVRSDKNREPKELYAIEGAVGKLGAIVKGRGKIEEEILANAAPKLVEFGIELLDVRFKRINYNESVRQQIYERMISERQQIAERYRSEGAGEAAKITGSRERELQKIESEAYRSVQEIRGSADAKASEIYANAYNQSRDAVEFYEFVKSLEAYQKILSDDTTMVLTTESDLFKYLKQID